jgi:hypothetical protein
MIAPSFAWNDVVDVHFTFVCTTYLTEATIATKHALTLFAVAPAI